MSELINRLSLAAASAKALNREATAQMLLQAVQGIEAAEARTAELREALHDMIDLADSRRSRDLAEVKRVLANARLTLTTPGAAAARKPENDEEVARAMSREFRSLLRRPA